MTDLMCRGTWSKHRAKGNADNLRKYMQVAKIIGTWDDGIQWYPDANKFVDSVVHETGTDARIITAVLSALSPNNKWENNKRNAREMVMTYCAGLTIDDVSVQTYNNNKKKAWSFLEGHDWKNGPKTTAFVGCITRPGLLNIDRLVVVDVWAARAYIDTLDFGLKCEKCSAEKGKIVTHGVGITDKEYVKISDDYRMVADEFGVTPDEAQAIVWVTAMKLSQMGYTSIAQYLCQE